MLLVLSRFRILAWLNQAAGLKDLEPRQRGVGPWSDLSMLRWSVSHQDKAPLHTFHKNTEQDRRKSAITSQGKEEMGEEETKVWRYVGWWSVPRKGLALKGRRGKQTWVEHAAHIIALACVYVHTERRGSILLLLVPASACIYGRHSANITSPSGDTGSEHYAG